ncbi:MAG: 2-oxo acid dehydrogenase subunit E2 [Spirochaetales bacterium]|nr:2-oxo acid dehydrogenase subunit E2 [Spirochaetales bacterium]
MNDYENIKMKKMPAIRRVISRKMTEAWAVPSFNITTEISMDGFLQYRKSYGKNLSLTAFIVSDLSRALKKHPKLNGIIQGESFGMSDAVHMGLALDGPDGLVVVTLRDADQKSIEELHEEIRLRMEELEGRRLSMDHITGATFTLSNLGAFGVSSCRAVLNPPQVGILGLGGSMKKMVPDSDGRPVVRSYMNGTLTADHRAVDGADGARFLQCFKQIIEEKEGW